MLKKSDKIMEYFSDKENGKQVVSIDTINTKVWNSIVAVYDGLIGRNAFVKDFPLECPDDLGVYGNDKIQLEDRIKGDIPNLEIPIRRKQEVIISPWDVEETANPKESTYPILDFIEFCYNHISDSVAIGKFHDYYNHSHLKVTPTTINKNWFRSEINTIFQRNGIAYELNEDGAIVRVIPKEFIPLIRKFATKDEILNNLLCESTQYILKPKIEDNQRALEKLWDAFERAKTYYSAKKNVSAPQLISIIANGNILFETYITEECTRLTMIGNTLQIRHFETDKVPIEDAKHMDYLYFRLMALINLFMYELEK